MTKRQEYRPPPITSLQTAWTKADYDKYVADTGRRPSDSTVGGRSAHRGQIRQTPQRNDQEVRTGQYAYNRDHH